MYHHPSSSKDLAKVDPWPSAASDPSAGSVARAATTLSLKHQILEGTTDCVFEVDQHGRFTYLNGRAIEEIASGRDLVGMCVLEAFPDLAGSIFWDRFGGVMRTGKGINAEGYFPPLRSWYEVHVVPTEESFVAFFRNINHRKRVEAELRDSSRQFEVMLDSVPEIVWTASAEGTCTYLNRRWYDFTGRTVGSDNGQGWLHALHPDDRDSARAAWTAALRLGSDFEHQFRLVTGSGSYRWVLTRATAMKDGDGRVSAWYGTCTDVHDQVSGEQRLRAILDALPEVIWSTTAQGDHDYTNCQWHEFTGASLSRADLEDVWGRLIHPDDIQKVIAAWRHSLATGEPYEMQYRLWHCSGEYRTVLSKARPQRDADGRIERWYGTCNDIEEQIAYQRALQASDALNRGIIEASPDAISLINAEGIVERVNGAAVALYGLSCPSALIGQPWGVRLAPTDRAAAMRALAIARTGAIGRFSKHHAGHWFDVLVVPIAPGEGSERFVAISRDITHQKVAEERARWTADHDGLTALPNRHVFQTSVDALIDRANRSNEGFAVLLFDLDDFKRTNDTLGHDAGDALLCAFAHRLRAAAGPNDVVARLGGDEFALLLKGMGSETEVEDAIEAITRLFKSPCMHNGKLLDLHASIGASLYPLHGTSRAELLKHADLALYTAKTTRRGRHCLFEATMRAESQRRSSMLSVARQALANDLITPWYQPKLCLATGRLIGFEALLRWTHPTRGVQFPSTIEAAFHDANLAPEISDRIIERVIRDVSEWRRAGCDFGHVAINAAATEFRAGDFAERLLARLHAAGLPASALQLEVTETVFLGRGAEYVERALQQLSEAGMEIALDDFGTGYASLSHLKQFPVNLIKIDRSFVRDIHVDPEDAAIVSAVINLGKSLGIKVVAEGVETERQHAFLRAAGCDMGQGFLYGQAVPAEHALGFCRAGDGGHSNRSGGAA